MIQTFEGVIDRKGKVQFLEPVKLPAMRRVLITILDEEPELSPRETAMLSEATLAVDWLTPEEDAALRVMALA